MKEREKEEEEEETDNLDTSPFETPYNGISRRNLND